MEATCWTLIRGAAGGDRAARDEFAQRYLKVVRAYLSARWSRSLPPEDLEDAVQEVFLECLREEGVLDRLGSRRPESFRTFLLGVVRNVARRVEKRRARRPDAPASHSFHPDELHADDESLSLAFDRAWATALLRAAAERQERDAADDAARRRVELLRLRFHEGRPIRDIASSWDVDPAQLHREYARARREFERALVDVVAFHNPGAPEAVARECRELIELLA